MLSITVRRVGLSLMGALFCLLSAVPTAAQQETGFSCVAQAAGTELLRAEGLAERVGDVLVICNGPDATAPNQTLRTVNIRVFTSPSINITSRTIGSSSTGQFSEALLFIDEPSPTQHLSGLPTHVILPHSSVPTLVAGPSGARSGVVGVPVDDSAELIRHNVNDSCRRSTADAKCSGRANAYVARQTGANSLMWEGIPFDPPGTSTTRLIRITNVRVNASQIGVPSGSESPVTLLISTSISGADNPIALPITVNQSKVTVGVAKPSISVSVDKAFRLATADDRQEAGGSHLAAKETYLLRVSESITDAFQYKGAVERHDVGVIYQTDSGSSHEPSFGLGLGNDGKQLILQIRNVPSNVRLLVAAPPGVTARTGILSADKGLSELSVSFGAVNAVWDISNTDTTSMESLEATVFFIHDKGQKRRNADADVGGRKHSTTYQVPAVIAPKKVYDSIAIIASNERVAVGNTQEEGGTKDCEYHRPSCLAYPLRP